MSKPARGAALLAIGTALPRHRTSQKQALRFLESVLAAGPRRRDGERAIELARRVYPASGIEHRHSVLSDFLEDDPARFHFFPPCWELAPAPGTAARMAVYERESVPLAVAAAASAIARAGVAAPAITHVVVSTCTGFFAPGLDVALVEALGLERGIGRTMLGFMGCYAGLTGIRTADTIVRAEPSAVVLQVAVELCSLHFQSSLGSGQVVANALFADGAAAALWSGDGGAGAPRVRSAASAITAAGREQMTWKIGDHGFEMTLGAAVPSALRSASPAFVTRLLDGAGLAPGAVGGYAIHPGGSAIIEAVRDALALHDRDVAASAEILRDCGNMSSAAILFVLERVMAEADGAVLALAFGPGLTMEGVVLGA